MGTLNDSAPVGRRENCKHPERSCKWCFGIECEGKCFQPEVMKHKTSPFRVKTPWQQ